MLFALAFTTTFRLDVTLVGNICTSQLEALRQVLDTTIVRLQRNLRLCRRPIFIIDRVLIAHQFPTHAVYVGTSKMTFFACTIVELESTIQLQVVVGIAKTTEGIRIPQQTIVLIRQHKWDRDFCIILEQILVFALHVELLALVLTQAIERLIIGRVELHLPGESVLLLLRNGNTRLHSQFTLGHREVPELFAILGLLEQLIVITIEERYFTGSLRNHRLHILSFHNHIVAFLAY